MSPSSASNRPREASVRDHPQSPAPTATDIVQPIPILQSATVTPIAIEPPQLAYPPRLPATNHLASYQELTSPYPRRLFNSSDVPPAPTSRSVSPQIATKYTMATEHAKLRAQSPLRHGAVKAEDEQENIPIVKQEEQHPPLHRPKSKLRLRLKLTPPHPVDTNQSETSLPSLKVKLLSSTTRTNETTVRKPTHKPETSVSTIRAHTPTKGQPYATTKQETEDTHALPVVVNGITHFPTRFESESPGLDSEDERHRRAADQQLLREKRTKGWFPPMKAIPRSRSAWNLRTAEGKATKSREQETERGDSGSFDSDFDGRSWEKGSAVSRENEVSRRSCTSISRLALSAEPRLLL